MLHSGDTVAGERSVLITNVSKPVVALRQLGCLRRVVVAATSAENKRGSLKVAANNKLRASGDAGMVSRVLSIKGADATGGWESPRDHQQCDQRATGGDQAAAAPR